jgi:hypothetical protein
MNSGRMDTSSKTFSAPSQILARSPVRPSRSCAGARCLLG